MKTEHIMCSQWPITCTEQNLHVKLTAQCVKYRSQVNSVSFDIPTKNKHTQQFSISSSM